MMLREWSRGALEVVCACPACGSSDRTDVSYERRDNDGLFPDVWCYVECASCLSLYLKQRPTPESISAAYAEYYTHEVQGSTVASEVGRRFISAIHGYLQLRYGMKRKPSNVLLGSLLYLIEPLRLKLDYYGRHLPRVPGSVFDVGCGNGDFLIRAKDMGWKVAGCDPDPFAVQAAIKQGLEVSHGFPEDVLMHQSRWDVITLGHVIEHVSEPLTLLSGCHQALRRGGQLWLATPNPSGIGLRGLGRDWMPFHPPYHFCIFQPASLKRLLRKSGFTSVRFVRRGMQSPSQWRLAASIAEREARPVSKYKLKFLRWLSDSCSTLFPQSSEELVVIAEKAE